MKRLESIRLFSIISLLCICLSSCLDDNDGSQYTITGSDIAVIKEYTPTTIYFEVATTQNTTVTLRASHSAALDPEQYAIGSKVYITYSMLSGQDFEKIVDIDLISCKKVESLTVDDAPAADCKLDYNYITVNSAYMAGGAINIIANVARDDNRTWKCLLDTDNSTADTAELYLITKAESTDYVGSTLVVAINVAPVLQRYSKIHLHLNNQQQTDFVYTFPSI